MRKLLHGLGYVAGIYALGIIIFTLFRLILFFVYSAPADGMVAYTAGQVAHAFWLGFRFDTVISCYILALPLLAVIVASFCRGGGRAVLRGTRVWVSVLYSVAFLLAAANIPYFLQFGKPINSSIWNWMNEPSFVLLSLSTSCCCWWCWRRSSSPCIFGPRSWPAGSGLTRLPAG